MIKEHKYTTAFLMLCGVMMMYMTLYVDFQDSKHKEENKVLIESKESKDKDIKLLKIKMVRLEEQIHLKNQVIEVLQKELELEKSKNPYSAAAYEPTNLSSAEINNAIYGTWLEGKGEILYKIEQENGVNFRFVYAIGSLESLRGKKPANTHNYFGIKADEDYRAFSSLDECLVYEGNLLANAIYKGKSIDNIAPTYCPPNAEKWARDVKIIMMEI